MLQGKVLGDSWLYHVLNGLSLYLSVPICTMKLITVPASLDYGEALMSPRNPMNLRTVFVPINASWP